MSKQCGWLHWAARHCYSEPAHGANEWSSQCDGDRSHERGNTGPTAQIPTHQGHAMSCHLHVQPARQPQRPVLSPCWHDSPWGPVSHSDPSILEGPAFLFVGVRPVLGMDLPFLTTEPQSAHPGTLSGMKARNCTCTASGTQRGHVERQLVAPSVPFGFLCPGTRRVICP